MPLDNDQLAAKSRLETYYDADLPYDPITNPGGLRNGGHRKNFEPIFRDVSTVTEGVAQLVDEAATSASTAVTSAAAAQSSAQQSTGNLEQTRAAKEAAQQAADVAVQAQPNQVVEFPSRAAAIPATIPASKLFIRTAGFAAPGDGGEDLFRRVSTRPVHPAQFTTADGAIWEKVSRRNVPEQFGATANTDAVDNYTSIAEWLMYSRHTGEILTLPARYYYFASDPVAVASNFGSNAVQIFAERGAKLKGPFTLDTTMRVYNEPVTVQLVKPGTSQNTLYTLSPSFFRPAVEKGLFITGGDLNRTKLIAVDTAGADMRVFRQFYPNDDGLTPISPASAGNGAITLNTPGGVNFAYATVPVRGAQELSAIFDPGSFTRALYILTSAGYKMFRADPGAAGTLATKPLGGNVSEVNLDWAGRGVLQSYAAENAWWAIRNYDGRQFGILINGHEIFRQDAGGVIEEIGFGALSSSAMAVTIREWTLRKNINEPRGAMKMSFVLVGDSFTADAHGGWPAYFREALYGSAGVDVGPISNLAISGKTSGDQLATLQASGIGAQTHGIIMVGVNDQQQGVTIDNYKANLRALIDYFQSRGRIAHVVVQSFFYDQSFAPGGAATSNYAKAAPYRAAALRIAAEKGVGVTDLNQSLKPMFASALTDGSDDPGLADNIHPTVLSRRLMGFDIARDVLSNWMPNFTSAIAPYPISSRTVLNGWTLGGPWPGKMSVSESGRVLLSGTIAAGSGASKAAGSKIMQLPRNMRPAAEDLFRARGQYTGIVTLDISTDGSVYLATDLTSSGDSWLSLAGISFDAQG